jgi:hypothetical protein
VNSYIREVAAQDFTARDFRYVGRTIEAVSELRAAGPADTETAQKTVVVEAVKQPLALFHYARQPPIGQLHSDRGSRRKKRFRSWANRTPALRCVAIHFRGDPAEARETIHECGREDIQSALSLESPDGRRRVPE